MDPMSRTRTSVDVMLLRYGFSWILGGLLGDATVFILMLYIGTLMRRFFKLMAVTINEHHRLFFPERLSTSY